MIENVISEAMDIFIEYLNKDENKAKLQIHLLNPIIKEISTRLGKYIFIMFFAYIIILILIIYILCTVVSSKNSL